MSVDSFKRLFATSGIILGAILIFFAAQIFSIFFIAIFLVAGGWKEQQIANWLTDNTAGQFTAVLVIEVLTLLAVWLVLKFSGRKWFKALKIKKSFKPADALLVVAGFAAYFAWSLIARIIISLLIPSVDLEQTQQIGFESANGALLALVFVALCVAVPIGEEILFRGLLFQGLKKHSSIKTAAIITSLIFGAAHLEIFSSGFPNWAAAIDTTIFSLILIWVYLKRNNLLAPIALHALKNSIAFIFLFVLGN